MFAHGRKHFFTFHYSTFTETPGVPKQCFYRCAVHNSKIKRYSHTDMEELLLTRFKVEHKSAFFTCMSFLLLQPCSSLLFWLWSDTSVLASFADDAGSAASETFIVSVSTLSDILIAKSYREMLANTEDLKDRNVSMRASIFGRERSSDDYA